MSGCGSRVGSRRFPRKRGAVCAGALESGETLATIGRVLGEVSRQRVKAARGGGAALSATPYVMGASVKEDRPTYGHLARDSEDAIRDRLEARAARDGEEMASAEGDD